MLNYPLEKEEYKDELTNRLDPTMSLMQGINAKIRKNPKRVIFAEGEDENAELEVNSITWSLLRFHWIPRGFVSEAWFEGQYPRLNTQRPDQRWVNKLLPSAYRAEYS